MSLVPPEETSFSAIVARLLSNLGPGADTNTGSMARTLAEAYAREMATFYAMMELAHRSGYLDTAEGAALDNVVAVLGLERARAGRLTGEVEFSRASPAPDDIGIPAGRVVTGPPLDSKPLPLFETQQDAVLRRGETRLVVRVQELREDDASSPGPSVIDPGRLTVMPRPVLGIEAVTNRSPLRRTGEDETDDSLRARARNALRDGEKGTLEAIAAAVRQQGVQQVTVREPEDAPPGVVDVLVGDPDFELDTGAVARVEGAIRASKAAGIRARLRYARTVYFQVSFRVEPVDPDLDEAAFDRLRRDLNQSLARFARELPVGTAVSRRKLEAVLYANPAVRRIHELVVETFVWGEDAAKPGDKVLVKETRVREQGPDRDWSMDPLETAAVDVERRPPRISRSRPLTWRLDLVVSLPASDVRTPEQVRQALRGAVDSTAARLAQQLQASREALIDWSALQGDLKALARVDALLSCTVTLETGLAVSLGAPGTPGVSTALPLKKDVRLVLGNAELVGSG